MCWICWLRAQSEWCFSKSSTFVGAEFQLKLEKNGSNFETHACWGSVGKVLPSLQSWSNHACTLKLPSFKKALLNTPRINYIWRFTECCIQECRSSIGQCTPHLCNTHCCLNVNLVLAQLSSLFSKVLTCYLSSVQVNPLIWSVLCG